MAQFMHIVYPKPWKGTRSTDKGVRALIPGVSSFIGYLPKTEQLQAGLHQNLANVKSQQSPDYTIRDLDMLFRKAGLPMRRTFPRPPLIV